jgi:hypothetical protein
MALFSAFFYTHSRINFYKFGFQLDPEKHKAKIQEYCNLPIINASSVTHT